MFFAWSYSAPPFRFKTKSWIEFPVVILGFGPLNYLYTALSVGHTNIKLLIPYFLYISFVLGQSQLNNCLKDFNDDEKSKSKNLSQHLGLKNSIKLRKALRLMLPFLLFFIIYFGNSNSYLSLALSTLLLFYTVNDLLKDYNKQESSRFTLLSSVVLILVAILQNIN